MNYMAKKRKTRKQRRANVVARPHQSAPVTTEVAPSSGPTVSTEATEVAAAPLAAKAVKRRQVAESTEDLDYVRADLRRIAVIVTICLAVEVILWFVMRTALGDHIYNLVSL